MGLLLTLTMEIFFFSCVLHGINFEYLCTIHMVHKAKCLELQFYYLYAIKEIVVFICCIYANGSHIMSYR
ncbi:uncharacterized protein B0P05DRAFT_535053 [Gilbertella persicaria]|uniref:uncharacterized protein n=1 Tax=Gilbertella persicaria TaxID=101096 RepID=UPI00221F9BB3|nr:uncharacterized protein B0P05DRAFT_535053 [Gilbertella persicaria]KAI8084310.1 hypothetical protein B0P05DRAFT_535053 [Gilbertella persicaria]